MVKQQIKDAPFVKEMAATSFNMYNLGWDERNGGNISYLLTEDEVKEYLDIDHVIRTIPMEFNMEELAGKYFIVTGSGIYFKNIINNTEEGLGIFRIDRVGKNLELLWGYSGEGLPTSELPSHLMSHIERLKVDSENRVVMHCHATNLLAMTFNHELKEKSFTKTLWKMCTECLVVFPDGIGIIPWIVPGTTEIGEATSNKMRETRLVIWPYHGVYGAGKTLDETFGLIETAEKAAEVYGLAKMMGGINQSISDEQLKDLAVGFKVSPKENYLD